MKVASRASDYIRTGDKSGKIMTHVKFNRREIQTTVGNSLGDAVKKTQINKSPPWTNISLFDGFIARA
jgi:hypothetical protein